MKLDGIRTEDVIVDVSKNDIIEAALTIASKKFKKWIPYDHIDDTGYWQEYMGTHPHKGDVLYNKKRKATKKEKEINDFLIQLQQLGD